MVDTLEFAVIQMPLDSLGYLPDLLHECHGLAAGDLYTHLTVPLHQATGAGRCVALPTKRERS